MRTMIKGDRNLYYLAYWVRNYLISETLRFTINNIKKFFVDAKIKIPLRKKLRRIKKILQMDMYYYHKYGNGIFTYLKLQETIKEWDKAFNRYPDFYEVLKINEVTKVAEKIRVNKETLESMVIETAAFFGVFPCDKCNKRFNLYVSEDEKKKDEAQIKCSYGHLIKVKLRG